ncbi:MAG: periplasmic protein CpxP/Spy [Alphaproteobacteria bacterium]|jgi:periplasmic protein CpxP/Spy|nr:periplasmic protein CpxP/Spy [Alphaproteobacteria bacterium]
MVDQNPDQAPARRIFGGGRGVLVMALLAVALLAGVAGNLLPPAFAQGFGMHHDWGGGFMGGTPTQAQIDDRIDRMTKHMAIELDATADQQAKIAGIAKSAVTDLRAMREKAQAARAQAVSLLTAQTIDRTAIERLRTEQIALAETASKRIAQALADSAEVLNPEQRKKVADWVTSGPWSRWHRG